MKHEWHLLFAFSWSVEWDVWGCDGVESMLECINNSYAEVTEAPDGWVRGY